MPLKYLFGRLLSPPYYLQYMLFFTRKNIKGKLTFGNFIFLLFTGSAIGLTNFFYYESVSYISASLAIVILMQFTWFSLLLEWLIFKSKPSKT